MPSTSQWRYLFWFSEGSSFGFSFGYRHFQQFSISVSFSITGQTFTGSSQCRKKLPYSIRSILHLFVQLRKKITQLFPFFFHRFHDTAIIRFSSFLHEIDNSISLVISSLLMPRPHPHKTKFSIFHENMKIKNIYTREIR